MVIIYPIKHIFGRGIEILPISVLNDTFVIVFWEQQKYKNCDIMDKNEAIRKNNLIIFLT